MGISTNGHINNEFDISHAVSFIKATEECKFISVEPSDNMTYFTIHFKYKEENRMMFFHTNLGIFGSHLISVKNWGEGVKVIEDMCKAFGGIYVPNDCTEEGIVMYEDRNGPCSYYNHGNVIHTHKWAIANRKIQDSTFEDIKEAQKAFYEWLNK